MTAPSIGHVWGGGTLFSWRNIILHFLTQSRDLGTRLCGNDSYGRPPFLCAINICKNSMCFLRMGCTDKVCGSQK